MGLLGHYTVIFTEGENMKTKMVLLYAPILAILAVILPFVNIPLPVGNPNLGSTPATLAAIYLPWPFCIIIAVLKGIAASIITGRAWVEMPAGIGDALMALFTYWLARHMHKGWGLFWGSFHVSYSQVGPSRCV
jgi:hypothetical protein